MTSLVILVLRVLNDDVMNHFKVPKSPIDLEKHKSLQSIRLHCSSKIRKDVLVLAEDSLVLVISTRNPFKRNVFTSMSLGIFSSLSFTIEDSLGVVVPFFVFLAFMSCILLVLHVLYSLLLNIKYNLLLYI